MKQAFEKFPKWNRWPSRTHTCRRMPLLYESMLQTFSVVISVPFIDSHCSSSGENPLGTEQLRGSPLVPCQTKEGRCP